MRIDRKKYLKHLTVINSFLLVIATLFALALLFVIWPQKTTESETKQPFERCDFSIKAKQYDINPGHSYVLYTNYACPYCAAFYNLYKGEQYTTRILLLDKDTDRFATQKIVSPFMLHLYKTDPNIFPLMEAVLFEKQDYWIGLEKDDLLHWLNSQASVSFSEKEIEDELTLLEIAEEEAPLDLQFVPALYSEGKRWDGLVIEMVG